MTIYGPYLFRQNGNYNFFLQSCHITIYITVDQCKILPDSNWEGKLYCKTPAWKLIELSWTKQLAGKIPHKSFTLHDTKIVPYWNAMVKYAAFKWKVFLHLKSIKRLKLKRCILSCKKQERKYHFFHHNLTRCSGYKYQLSAKYFPLPIVHSTLNFA